MKLKAAISEDAPQALFDAFGSRDFAQAFIRDVVAHFRVDNPFVCPAEYYVQKPDKLVQMTDDIYGVEVRLTGVSRHGRSPRVFHNALIALTDLITNTICEAMPNGPQVQVFVVMMLDGEIETRPGSGVYSSVLESEPYWMPRFEDIEKPKE